MKPRILVLLFTAVSAGIACGDSAKPDERDSGVRDAAAGDASARDAAAGDASARDAAAGDASARDAAAPDAAPRDAAARDSASSDGPSGDGGLPTEGVIIAPIVPSGSDSPQLFRMKPDGSGLTQLTTSTGAGLPTDANDFPVLARDGKTLYFASGREHPSSHVDGGDLNPMYRTIWVMDVNGGTAHRLTKNEWLHCNEYPEDVSPDGNWVVFHMTCDNLPATANGVDKLFRIHPDGTGQEMLATSSSDPLSDTDSNAGMARFTRDGKTLVYWTDAGGENSGELWTLDLPTMTTKQLTHTGAANSFVRVRQPMIAPDQRTVYFSSDSNDLSTARVEKINLDGTGNGVLFEMALDATDLGFVENYFALSPDGSHFLISTDTAGTTSLVVADLDGKNRKTIYPSALFIGWGGLVWR